MIFEEEGRCMSQKVQELRRHLAGPGIMLDQCGSSCVYDLTGNLSEPRNITRGIVYLIRAIVMRS